MLHPLVLTGKKYRDTKHHLRLKRPATPQSAWIVVKICTRLPPSSAATQRDAQESSLARQYCHHSYDEGMQFRHVVLQELLRALVRDRAIGGDETRLELDVCLDGVHQW